MATDHRSVYRRYCPAMVSSACCSSIGVFLAALVSTGMAQATQSSTAASSGSGTDMGEIIALTIAAMSVIAVVVVAVFGWRNGYLPGCGFCRAKGVNPYSRFNRPGSQRSFGLGSLRRSTLRRGAQQMPDDDNTRLAPLAYNELIASCPSGLDLILGQAVTATDDYAIPEYYDSDSDREQAQSLQGLPPLKFTDSSNDLKMDLETAPDPNHPEDAYALVNGNFRYLAPATVEEQDSLGEGEFGFVKKGRWKSSKRGEIDVALKTPKPDGGSLAEDKLIKEAHCMGPFEHRNVLQLYGVILFGEQVTLVIEYMEHGSLLQHLSSFRSMPDKHTDSTLPPKLLRVCCDVIAGLAYLAQHNFIHRDIAARNILVGTDYQCKIGDFGMSRLLADESFYMSRGGKLPTKWSPPEVINYRKFSLASDIWSFGIVLYEIWSLAWKPYIPWSNEKVAKEVLSGYRLPPPPGCSRHIYKIMMDCWHPDSQQRPTAETLQERFSIDDKKLLALPKLNSYQANVLGLTAEAYQLGAAIETAQALYKDVQETYAHFSKEELDMS